jgi:capsular polysaccharide biosynthesis protein
VVVAGAHAPAWRTLIATVWPELSLVVVTEGDDESEAHARLCTAGPVDVVVQAADTAAFAQTRMFQRVFMHLRDGGTYLTPTLLPWTAQDDAAADAERAELAGSARSRPLPNEDYRPAEPYEGDLWQMISEAQAARLRDFGDHLGVGQRFEDVRGLGRRLAQVHVFSKALRVRSEGQTRAKLTEREADAVLAAHPEIGREVDSLEPTSLTARAAYVHNLAEDRRFASHMTVPKLTLRAYERPVCSRGQIVTSDNLLLPDTFRHHLAPRLVNVYVEESGPRFGQVRRDISDPDPLPGAWFNLDSEWPGHFGHMVTELLGRMWAWERAKEEQPDLKILLTLQHDRVPAALRQFELDILGAFGISAQDVHIFDRPCRPEILYSATSMFSLPDYVHPQVVQTWDLVGDHLAGQADDRPRPRRIFCTRPRALKRSCRNATEVEDLFAGHGFEVISPERHPVPEQVAAFRAAEVVAGFGGSGLFTLALCNTPKKVFTVAPSSYTARNEHLIAAARGHEMTSVWCRPDLQHPRGSWTQEAFASDFRFEMEDEGVFLIDQLEKLGPPR